MKKPHTPIYADAAASTPIHPRVGKRMIALLDTFGNPGGLHAEALAAAQELEGARREIAEAIGAHSDEIIFTASGTESNDLAIFGVLRPLLREHKSVHAITLPIEHPSVLEPLEYLKKHEGLSLTHVEVDGGGLVSPKDVYEAIAPNTAFISIQLVNSEIGVIEPVREIAKMIRRARRERAEAGNTLPIVFHVDAAQAPLYLDLKVDALGVDLMTLDAQKVQGPKSIGVLYRRRGIDVEPMILGGTQERGQRAGTGNCVLAAAFAEALAIAQKGVEARTKKVAVVRDYLLSEIQKAIPSAEINGTMKSRIPNNLNISIPGLDGETAVIALDAAGIAISTRSACSTEDENPSHVLAALGHSQGRARTAVRITLLPDATKQDAKRITRALFEAYTLYQKPHDLG